MQALRFHSHGTPAEVLTLEELPAPPLADGQVRLRMLAAPINPADLNLIEGNYGIHPDLPATGGLEGCGEVIESRVEGYETGDRVIALRPVGSWATEAVAKPENLYRLPAGIDPLQAAMLKVNPATAWRLLKGFGELPEGSWVVQNAANSAVGRCVITIARHLGIRTLNLVRRAELIDELKDLGGDEVLLDDDGALENPGERDCRLAFNCVGGESSMRLMKMLGHGGIHITYGAMAKRPVTVSARSLIFEDIQVRGLWVTRWIDQAGREELAATYDALAELMASGVLSIPVEASFGLADYRAALERLAAPERNGKVLFTPE